MTVISNFTDPLRVTTSASWLSRLMYCTLITGAACVPMIGNHFFLQVVMIPILVFSIAAIGLNLMTGYTGLASLGTGAFMGVGAYACYKLTTIFPDINIIVWLLASGFFSAAVGILFGLPSLRIKGFYLAISTLAAQFFLEWCFNRVPWLYNYNISGAIEVPERKIFGIIVTGANASAEARYYVVLAIATVATWVAANIVSGRLGRNFMAIRDMDVAAELIGVKLFESKLLAFAISSYYCGVAGAMMVFLWYATGAEYHVFDINQSFFVLSAIIVGGLGSIFGSYLGVAFVYGLPILLGSLANILSSTFGIQIESGMIEHFRLIIVGLLIVTILIAEPHGLARLLQMARLRLLMQIK